MSKSGLSKFVIGAGIGFGIGILVAAKSGKETRQDLKNKFKELEYKMKNLDMSDLKDGAINKLDEIKDTVRDLDFEQVSTFTKEKVDTIRIKLSELSSYLKKKSAPVIKKVINEINEKLDEVES